MSAVASIQNRMNTYGAISRAIPKLLQPATLRPNSNLRGLATTTTMLPNQAGRVRNWPSNSNPVNSFITARNYSSNNGTKYEIRFANNTSTSRYFAVYQKFPNAPGLRSVAWKVVGIPPGGTGSTQWTMDFGVAIANWQTGPPGIYAEQQIVPAQLGEEYKIVQSPNDIDIPMINPKPTKDFSSDKDLIKLVNTTPQKMISGLALSGNLLAVEDLNGGETSNFIVHPTYYVATFRNIKPGMMLDSGAQLTPVKVEFEHGATIMQVAAMVDAGLRKLVATTVE